VKTKNVVKVLISAAIFVAVLSFIVKRYSFVGVDLIPLSSLQWGLGRIWITFYLVLMPSFFAAIIPLIPVIWPNLFLRSWEK
jgi:hypothetical protein